eukprot:c661_g1_i1.p1 GENE.c661_g1_i1~~c661_g1_i1.p1  ORF type:complete len:233 (+),score=56.82 c661_g1_i1:54-701(+)
MSNIAQRKGKAKPVVHVDGESDDEPLDQVNAAIDNMSAEEAKKVAEKVLKDKIGDINSLSEREIKKHLKLYNRQQRQPCSKTCLFVAFVFIAAIFGLRAMEDVYDPTMEEIESQFRILELPTTATDEQIRKQYRSLQKKFHPDRCRDPNCADQAIEINKAYEILTSERHITRYRSYVENMFKAAEMKHQEYEELKKSGFKQKQDTKRRRHTGSDS